MPTRPDRGSVLAAALIVVTLIVGLAGGIAVDRWVLRPHRPGGRAQVGWAADARFDPARVRARASSRLAEELGLTAEQHARVDSLMRRQQREAAGIMGELRPRLDSVTARTQAELRTVLTAEQWHRFDSLHAGRHDGMRHR
jgi:Spy/CpxP family protein refolding chaperone